VKKVFSVLLVFLLVQVVLPAGISGWDAPAMAAPGIVKIAAGANHSLALFSDGSLYAWGDNTYGQVGDGSVTNATTPQPIGTGFTDIAAGDYHSLAVKGGVLYSWGYNGDGQLCDGTTIDRRAPWPVAAATGITAIAAGGRHTLALRGTTLWACGKNDYGQLGDKSFADKKSPVQVATMTTGVTAIAAGGYHSLALKGNVLWAWGRNTYGQLGDGSRTHSNEPLKIGAGYNAIAAGGYHSLALMGGALYAWGYNGNGQLGDGKTVAALLPKQIVAAGCNVIAAGEYHSLGLRGNSLYGWGYNRYGQVCDGTNIDQNQPAPIVGTGYTAIAAGSGHTLVLKGGILYAVGLNTSGQLGDGTKISKFALTEVKFPKTTIDITYHSNDPLSPASWTDTIPIGPYTVATNTFVRKGFTFVEWNTKPGGGAATAVSEKQYFAKLTSNYDLYAQWTAVPPPAATVTITYYSNDPANLFTTVTIKKGDPHTALDSNTFTRAGFTFVEWNTQPGGGGTKVTAKQLFPSVNSDQALYAQWTPVPAGPTVTITYKANYAGAVPAEKIVSTTKGAPYQILKNTFFAGPVGKSFKGWNAKADGSGNWFAELSNVVPNANHILYAIWK